LFTEHMMPYTLLYPKSTIQIVSGKIFFMQKINLFSQYFHLWTNPVFLSSGLEMSPIEQVLESHEFSLAEKKEFVHSLYHFTELWLHVFQNLKEEVEPFQANRENIFEEEGLQRTEKKQMISR